MQKKRDLPQKICRICNLPFSWRKKWKKDWQNIRYCSQRCRNQSRLRNLSNKGQ
ncbi:MAG: hypothetical protein CBC09_00990 [Cellvibrionales bacterium TMED49]|nr:hypothetical protein [Porticoccaceae bacterium]OUU40128.1 MAG: hypothetical protein CBC09_00990 [Cellvibrionales bacterium TMED49]